MMQCFHYDAHPMGMLISTLASSSTFHPEANPALAGQTVYKDEKLRNKQIHRLLGTVPTIAAQCYRQRIGRPYNLPKQGLGYVENFLYMLDSLNEKEYKVFIFYILHILHIFHILHI
jgi:citrate synthase